MLMHDSASLSCAATTCVRSVEYQRRKSYPEGRPTDYLCMIVDANVREFAFYDIG